MKNFLLQSLVRTGLSLLLLVSLPLSAQTSEIKVQRQGEYTFISGGLTDEEITYMEGQAPKYPIQLMFRNKGLIDNVKDVLVRVRNVSGDVMIETLSKGPYVYINPPASGRFTIEAELNQEKFSMTKDLVGRRYLHLLFEFGRVRKEQ